MPDLGPSSETQGQIVGARETFKQAKKKNARRIRAGTAKKCTQKRDARAELLFCFLSLLLFDVAVTLTVVVSLGP